MTLSLIQVRAIVHRNSYAASLALLFPLLLNGPLHAQTSKCLPADSMSVALILDLQRIVTATDAWTV